MSFIYAIVILAFIESLILIMASIRGLIFILTVIFKREKKSEDSKLNPGPDPEKYFVSVLLPIYNEVNVVDRLLRACTSFTFPSYEVIVVDDSTDETVEILKKWRKHPKVKVIHRNHRKGWKGGALNTALENLNPKSTHIMVFDADFIPPPNLLEKFLEKFENNNEIMIVQGYQRHTLNKDENWVTKGIRVLHSMIYLVEFDAKSKLGLPVPVTGSVFMIRTELLKKFKFSEDITEDWNLTMRLYAQGYKVHYDPKLVAFAECPSGLLEYFCQQMRWAEGHTRNYKRHLWRVLTSKKLSLKEKLEFMILAISCINAVPMIMLLVAWILAFLFPSLFPEVYSSPLIPLSMYLSLPSIPVVVIANTLAMIMDGTTRDALWLPYTILLYYITLPGVAFAVFKGLLTKEYKEYFRRTYKTGKITDKSVLSWIRG